MDQPNDTHRHLSHLIGLYPGYAVSNFDSSIQTQNGTESFTRDDVLAAAQTSLIHRGNGTGPDADSGWEKVWRAACWAQLANASTFYHELTVCLFFPSPAIHVIHVSDRFDSMQSSVILQKICLASTIQATQTPFSKLTQTSGIPVQSWYVLVFLM